MTAIIDPKPLVGGRIRVVESGPKPSATNTRPGLTLNRKQVDWRAAMQSNEPEIWKPIAGYEGAYEVSDNGRVRSLDRHDARGKFCPGQVLRPTVSPKGHLRVSLSGKSASVHRLVAEAFLGSAPEGKPNVLHWDDVPANNHLSNLRWGSDAENKRDAIRNGRNPEVNKTHCVAGHPYAGENVHVTPKGARRCTVCDKARQRRNRGRPELDGVGDLRPSLTPEQAAEAVASADTHAALGRRYGVSESTIRRYRKMAAARGVE